MPQGKYLAGGLQSGCTANSTGVQYKSSIICANPAFFLSVFLSVRFYHNTKQCDLHYLFIHSGRLTHNIRLFAKIIVQQLSSVDTDIYLCWRKGDLKKDLHFPENHIYYLYTDIFTSSESFYHAWLMAMVLAYRRIIIEECYRKKENCVWQRREELLYMKGFGS